MMGAKLIALIQDDDFSEFLSALSLILLKVQAAEFEKKVGRYKKQSAKFKLAVPTTVTVLLYKK
jgi:hypothetical protein